MKNIFYILILFLLVSSCELTGIKTKCDEKLEFTQQELSWGQEWDSLFFLSSRNDTIKFVLLGISDAKLSSECPTPATKQIGYNPTNTDKFSQISFHLSKSESYGSNIAYKFNSSDNNSQVNIVGSSQDMGYIDIEKNESIDIREIDYTQTTKLGTHELNGKIYDNVFVIEDLKESEVPQIDISRFYVNPSGILRIEFYDGEIWDRVD